MTLAVVKMVGKCVENIEEIRAYLKFQTKLGHLVKQIFTEFGKVYGSKTVLEWRKRFQTSWHL